MTKTFLVGDRITTPDCRHGMLATVVEFGDGFLTAWVDSQCCEFEYAYDDVTLVMRPVFMTPERIDVLEKCLTVCTIGPLQLKAQPLEVFQQMLAEAKA
jgi:hypothetical protein